jgi:hypothetical protein
MTDKGAETNQRAGALTTRVAPVRRLGIPVV